MKQINVTLTREASTIGNEYRIYLRQDYVTLDSFPDTDAGMELARKAYNDRLHLLRNNKGAVPQVLMKEVLTFDEPEPEKKVEADKANQ